PSRARPVAKLNAPPETGTSAAAPPSTEAVSDARPEKASAAVPVIVTLPGAISPGAGLSTERVGGTRSKPALGSLSRLVYVSAGILPSVALAGADSVTRIVSEPSVRLSSTTPRDSVWAVWPGAKVTTPETGSAKSAPGAAVPVTA